MNRTGRRLAFWILFVAYLAGTIWWLLHIPHRPADLLRAIPGQANLISFHRGLADRWDETTSHPVSLMIAGALGVEAEDWADLRSAPATRRLIDLLGRDELAIARLPGAGFQRDDIWVISSWLGGRSQLLGWFDGMLGLSGLESQGRVGHWPVWTYAVGASSPPVTIALVEGMLIATSARHPQAVEMILNAYDGNFPSVATRDDLAPWRQRILASSFPDRIWLKTPARSAPQHWFAEWRMRSGEKLDGAVVTDASLPLSPLSANFDLAALAEIWRDAPAASAALGVENLARPLRDIDHLAAQLVRDALLGSGAESAALGLFADPYNGRIAGIRVPTLMIALQRPGGFEPATILPALLDRWNSRHFLGLVTAAERIGGYDVWRIEGVTDGLYSMLGENEQVALTTNGNWLIISSNFAALEQLIRDSVLPGAAAIQPWAERMNELAARDGLGYVGMDLERGVDAVKLALTAYSLQLLFVEGDGATREQRQFISELKAWLDTLAKMNRLHLLAANEDDLLNIEVQAGR
jgi:hypothetical protein